MLAKNAFWHEIATQGHLRSFILQSVTGRQEVAYRHNIAGPGLISNVYKEVATQIAKKLLSSTTPLLFDSAAQGNPREYAYALYFRTLESLGYISAADSMGLFSFV